MKAKLMSFFSLAVVGLVLTAFIAPEKSMKGDAPAWSVDAAHSSVTFSVRHIFTPTEGTFDKFDGVIKFDPDHLHASSATFTIDVASINTKNEKRDNHLRSADFFNVEKFPKMTFQSSSITKSKEGSYIAMGRMTIKDVTKPMEIPFQFLGAMPHPMMEGMTVAGMRAEFKLNRTDFGVGSGDWASTAVIGDEVSVVINLEVGKPS